MATKSKIKWLSEPEEHDYIAAMSYLSLLWEKKTAKAYIKKLQRAAMSEFKSKDIFRAASLPLTSLKSLREKVKAATLTPQELDSLTGHDV